MITQNTPLYAYIWPDREDADVAVEMALVIGWETGDFAGHEGYFPVFAFLEDAFAVTSVRSWKEWTWVLTTETPTKEKGDQAREQADQSMGYTA